MLEEKKNSGLKTAKKRNEERSLIDPVKIIIYSLRATPESLILTTKLSAVGVYLYISNDIEVERNRDS